MHKLPQLIAGKSLLLLESACWRDYLFKQIAHFAVDNRVRVLVMGNRFDSFTIARHMRRQTVEVAAALDRISIARVFTCYEAAALLETLSAETSPTFILDLLTTFHDDSIATIEAYRLLQRCIEQIERLRQQAPLIISASQPTDTQPDRIGLLAVLKRSADHVIDEQPTLPPQQLQLLNV